MRLSPPLVSLRHAKQNPITAAKAAAGCRVLSDDVGLAYSQDGQCAARHAASSGFDERVEKHAIYRARIPSSTTVGKEPISMSRTECDSTTKTSTLLSDDGEETPIHAIPSSRLTKYATELSRLLNAIHTNIGLRMAERYCKMTGRLGRNVKGRKWWID